MDEWKETILKEVAAIDTGYAFKGDRYTDAGSLRVVRGMNVTVKDLRWGTDAKYWEHGTSGLEKYFLRESDIVIGMDGSRIGENRAMVKAHDLPSILAQRVARIRCIPDVTDQDFLWQVIAAENFVAFIKSIFTGTSIPHISQGQLGSYELRLPPLPEQRAIASVLSSLDAKIDLLHRQNKTLEAMAETLFRQWFVEEAEEGWEEKPMGSFGRIVCGKTPSKKVAEYHNGSIPFIRIPDMHGQVYLMHAMDSITEKGKASQLNKTLPAGAVCVSCIATVGLVSITTRECQTNQQINSIIPGKEHYRYYLYLLMLSMYDELHAMASGGTATLNLNTSSFTKMLVPSPPDEVLRDFNDAVAPLFAKMLNNCEQLTTLTKLRDTLLPKLMSGEVRVEMVKRTNSVDL